MTPGRVPASARRLREARARGDVAHAPTLTAAAALGGGVLALALTARPAAARLVALARAAWSGEGAASALVPSLAAILMPVAVAAFVAALVAGLAQTRFNFAWGALGRRSDEPEPWPAGARWWRRWRAPTAGRRRST